MSKTSSASKIKMKSFEDLFGTNEVVGAKNISGEIRDIPLNSLHTFRNHPFKVREEKLDELVESVKQHGVLVPGIARMRPQGGYEIIAGHTRKAACELAGLDTMPMFIRNLNDDEATIVMVDSNIQREDILPSERARAYSMRYYAMKHQGIKGNGMAELDSTSGIGLIEKIRRGLGKPDIIYVKNFVGVVAEQARETSDEFAEVPKSNFKKSQNQICRSSKIELQEVPEKDFKKSQDKTSRSSNMTPQEVSLWDSNYTYKSNTYENYTNLINPSDDSNRALSCKADPQA